MWQGFKLKKPKKALLLVHIEGKHMQADDGHKSSAWRKGHAQIK